MSNDPFSLAEFAGKARLFPLPNLVVFPHVVQPLHIFESRYVEMLEHAVADDHLLAMALLLPGWQPEYDSRPPIEQIICLGRVMSHSPAKQGTYNILLGGISRAKVKRELPVLHSYREAEIELLQDINPEPGDDSVRQLHSELVRAFRRFIPAEAPVQRQFEDLLNEETSLGTLTDLISYSLPLDLAFRQTLLAELDVLQRCRLLLDELQKKELAEAKVRSFPPEFSSN